MKCGSLCFNWFQDSVVSNKFAINSFIQATGFVQGALNLNAPSPSALIRSTVKKDMEHRTVVKVRIKKSNKKEVCLPKRK